MPLRGADGQPSAPGPRARRHSEIIRPSRRVMQQIIDRPLERVLPLHAQVHPCEGREQQQDDNAGAGKVGEQTAARQTRTYRFGRDGHRDGDGQEVEIVPVRQGLQEKRRGKRGEHPARSGDEIAVQRPQRQRHPAGHQHLQVRHLPHPVGTEREREAGKQRSVRSAPERSRQEKGADAGEDIRRQKRDVVHEHRVVRQPLERRREDGDAEHVLGVGQRVVVRIEKRRFPQIAKSMGDPVCVPGEQKCDEYRITESGRKRRGDARDQRIRGGDRHHGEDHRDGEHLTRRAASRHRASISLIPCPGRCLPRRGIEPGAGRECATPADAARRQDAAGSPGRS